MTLSRRHFLRTAGAVSLGFAGLHQLFACREASSRGGPVAVDGFGPLVPDPDGLLELPEGFTYTVFSRGGAEMDDGLLVPALHDGMATFPGPRGLTLLVRNHEVNAGDGPEDGPFGPGNERLEGFNPDFFFDGGHPGHDGGLRPALGGTTTLLFDTERQELVGHRLSLTGTLRNCAGGPTPWGSWITCEESVQPANDRFTVAHGYNFEVPAVFPPRRSRPVPLREMGRFNHEAVAVHPESGIVYQTEDRSDGLLYRFLPDRPGDLAAGGRLQALAVRGEPGLDTRNWGLFSTAVEPGATLEVEWLDLENVAAPDDGLRHRGHDAGAARFARGEGMWYGEGAVFFACTNGGPAEKGQIWKYAPSPREGRPGERSEPATLELFVEADAGAILENADNLTVSPWGDLIVCEDGTGDDYLVGVTPEGELYRFGHNVRDTGELAGACFSPDGSTLFVNVQSQSLTVAITGPWDRRTRSS